MEFEIRPPSKETVIGVGSFIAGATLGLSIPLALASGPPYTPPNGGLTIPGNFVDFLKKLTVFRRDWSPFHRNLDPSNWWVKPFSYAKTENYGEDLVLGVELNFTQAQADTWTEIIMDINNDPRRILQPWWIWIIGSGAWTGDLMYNEKVIWTYMGLEPTGQDYQGQAIYDPFRKVVPPAL